MLSCKFNVREDDEEFLHLSFAVTNAGSESKTLRYFDPFMDFSLIAETEGREFVVVEPEVNIPVRPVELELAAGESTTIETPVRFWRGEEESEASDDMTWVIVGNPAVLTLKAVLRIGEVVVESDAAKWPA